MTQSQITYGEDELGSPRSMIAAARNGATGHCPNCGEGKVFDGFLKIKDQCDHCEEALYHHRADDLPAYLNIFIVGHVVLGAVIILMRYELLGMWETMFVTIAVCIASALLLMRPLKGMVVATQWALRMHGFGGDDD